MARHVLVEIVEQHAEEAAFLWILRAEAIRAPNHDLATLAELDERIDAHLDGLRVAGAHGWEACREQLAWRERGEVFAAAHVALQSRIGRRFDAVLDVAAESIELSRGVVGALAWLSFSDAGPTITTLLQSTDPIIRRIGIAASTAHRRDPGAALGMAAAGEDPALRARAVKAAGELGRRDLMPLCNGDTEGATGPAFGNAWSTTLLGGAADGALQRVALTGGPFAEAACDLAVRRMAANDALAWQHELAGAGQSRLAIVAARALGDPTFVPWIIDVMQNESLARAAGEVFTTMTGVELGSAGLSVGRPVGFESGPNDDPNDDNVAIDPDEHLPWPSPRAVAGWWSKNGHGYANGTRYLTGRPLSTEWLGHVLLHGRQRQRSAAALELVLGEPGRPLFAVKARADYQLRALSGAAIH